MIAGVGIKSSCAIVGVNCDKGDGLFGGGGGGIRCW